MENPEIKDIAIITPFSSENIELSVLWKISESIHQTFSIKNITVFGKNLLGQFPSIFFSVISKVSDKNLDFTLKILEYQDLFDNKHSIELA